MQWPKNATLLSVAKHEIRRMTANPNDKLQSYGAYPLTPYVVAFPCTDKTPTQIRQGDFESGNQLVPPTSLQILLCRLSVEMNQR